MRIKKETYFLISFTANLLTIFSGLFLFISFIVNYKTLTINNEFILAGMVMYIGFSIKNMILSIYLFSTKIYKNKREKSALIIGIIFSPLLFSTFVLLNAYNKSGLSKYQRKEAQKLITLKNMRKILKRKEVIKSIKEDKEFAVKLNNITQLRDKKYESEAYINENFYDLLLDYKVDIGFIPNESELIEVGKYL